MGNLKCYLSTIIRQEKHLFCRKSSYLRLILTKYCSNSPQIWQLFPQIGLFCAKIALNRILFADNTSWNEIKLRCWCLFVRHLMDAHRTPPAHLPSNLMHIHAAHLPQIGDLMMIIKNNHQIPEIYQNPELIGGIFFRHRGYFFRINCACFGEIHVIYSNSRTEHASNIKRAFGVRIVCVHKMHKQHIHQPQIWQNELNRTIRRAVGVFDKRVWQRTAVVLCEFGFKSCSISYMYTYRCRTHISRLCTCSLNGIPSSLNTHLRTTHLYEDL